MVRKNPENFVHKDTLLTLLATNENVDIKVLKSQGKNDLCWRALDQQLITQEECNASLVRRTSTIPCYLYTHVQIPEAREKIELYVRCYSMLFTRGSYIANLILNTIGLPTDMPTSFPIKPYCTLPKILSNENILKTCFLPERWLRKNLPIDPSIQDVLNVHSERLSPYLPKYKDVMADCGWDNAINHMGSTYMGHVKVQTMSNLPHRVKQYLKIRPLHPDTNRDSFMFCAKRADSPSTQIHCDDMEWLIDFRNQLNLGIHDYLDSAFDGDLDSLTWGMHLWLLVNIEQLNVEKGFSILPVVTLNRKYAYIDNKIAQSLFTGKLKKQMLELTEGQEGSDLQKLLGLTTTLFNSRKAAIRKNLRKRERTKQRWYKKKGKNGKRYGGDKWIKRNKFRKNGRSSLPPGARLKCVNTDGVGLRLCLEFVPSRPIVKQEELFPENTLLVGKDTGRVRMSTTVDSDGKVSMMTRQDKYNAERHTRMQKWENDRRAGTPWATALAAIATAGGFRNRDLNTWMASLDAQNQHLKVILEEQLYDKERAKKKMVRFRWRRSWMDRRIRELLAPAWKDGRHMVIGRGDGSFSSTGKGELSVPTVGIEDGMRRIIKMTGSSHLVKQVPVCEENSTKCCHHCGEIMKKMRTRSGKECLRYRLCTKCGPKTDGKRRHRDVNAARNILMLLKLMILGLPRPKHLTCSWRRMKPIVGLPQFVKTARVPF